MSAEDNKATFRKAVDELNKGNVDGLLGLCTSDYKWHGPGGQERENFDELAMMQQAGAIPAMA